MVEREVAINLIMGLCELSASPVPSDIGANDFIGVNYIHMDGN